MTISALQHFYVDKTRVEIYPSMLDASVAAATKAASIFSNSEHAVRESRFRIVVATGPALEDLIKALVQTPSINWDRVDVFHMDEYVGMPASHPASFRRWLKTHLVDIVHPAQVHYLEGDAPDLERECQRYENLLRSAPIDICLLGFGENGHIAFNDPPNADFQDPLVVKKVDLDEKCRLQQVGEGHFASLQASPREALTLTCPFLMSARHLICCVPERRKAEAVRNAIEGPISPSCPASLVRVHSQANIYLDVESASQLSSLGQESKTQTHSEGYPGHAPLSAD
jgi:glucosamine-6-phosphate deaminase